MNSSIHLQARSTVLFIFLPSYPCESFVNRIPQLASVLLVKFFDFLFFNPIRILIGEAINHVLLGNGCAMPHGLGQLPVEIRSSAVGVSATTPTCLLMRRASIAWKCSRPLLPLPM
jgi:hypothetical protein